MIKTSRKYSRTTQKKLMVNTHKKQCDTYTELLEDIVNHLEGTCKNFTHEELRSTVLSKYQFNLLSTRDCKELLKKLASS